MLAASQEAGLSEGAFFTLDHGGSLVVQDPAASGPITRRASMV